MQVILISSKASDSTLTGRSNVTETAYNVMMLIDKSGSMNKTDINGLALSAACQFISQLREVDKSSGGITDLSSVTKVGVMSFDLETQLVANLITVDRVENVEYLQSCIRSIEYNELNTGSTDLNTAFFDAAMLLKKHHSDSQKNIILLYTDGESTKDAKNRPDFNNKLEDAITIAAELSCSVYVVGLNSNNKIKAQGIDEIRYIADSTQTGVGIVEPSAEVSYPYPAGHKVNYIITDDFNDVRFFYGSIFAHMFSSILEPVENDHEFQISNGVIEATVLIYSDAPIKEVTIRENGTEVREDGKKIIISGDTSYKVIKIVDPEVGWWKVTVSTNTKAYITYVVRIYGIEIVLTATYEVFRNYDDTVSGYTCTASVVPMYKGEPYREEEQISIITKAEVSVSAKGLPDVLGRYPLSYQKDTKTFTTAFPINPGEYIIEATVENPSMTRTAKYPLTVNKADDPSIPTTTPTSIPTTTPTSIPTTTPTSITTTPPSKAPAETPISLSEFILEHWYYGPILIVFALLILIAIIKLPVERRYRFDIDVRLRETEKNREHKEEGCVTRYPRGRSFSLWKIVNSAILVNLSSSGFGTQKPVLAALAEQLIKDKRSISRYRIKLVYTTIRGKRKRVYKVQNPNGHLVKIDNQIDNVKCYSNGNLEIYMQITKDEEFFGELDDDIVEKRSRNHKRKPRKSINDDYYRV